MKFSILILSLLLTTKVYSVTAQQRQALKSIKHNLKLLKDTHRPVDYERYYELLSENVQKSLGLIKLKRYGDNFNDQLCITSLLHYETRPILQKDSQVLNRKEFTKEINFHFEYLVASKGWLDPRNEEQKQVHCGSERVSGEFAKSIQLIVKKLYALTDGECKKIFAELNVATSTIKNASKTLEFRQVNIRVKRMIDKYDESLPHLTSILLENVKADNRRITSLLQKLKRTFYSLKRLKNYGNGFVIKRIKTKKSNYFSL
ncbi:MAG: hypothetical protein ISR65_09065 [Bacteriovoracaceae bacterium]|nr:hypothetical protein [Bacteriovoracaceae bacterium]